MVINNNFDIKLKDSYKLYVLLKDKIVFENELKKNGIRFYFNLDEQPNIDSGIRYFLLISDLELIDQILSKKEIFASTETILISDYKISKKVMKLYINLAIIFIIFLVVFWAFISLFKG